eukprot:6360935-Prorocentrum_lima.AAC.1
MPQGSTAANNDTQQHDHVSYMRCLMDLSASIHVVIGPFCSILSRPYFIRHLRVHAASDACSFTVHV